jgi:alpha-L-glutamate ligase-like protein
MTGSWRFWAWPWELKRCGVLGLNARNLEMLLELNPRPLNRLVDDKAATKEICRQHEIPTPATYGIVEHFGQLASLDELLAGREEFVVKPARGSGGRGILVIAARRQAEYITSGGQSVSAAELGEHVAGILAGLHCAAGQSDKAIIEERISPHAAFAEISADGTPDLRIVLQSHRALAAMLRLPTARSGGRANLHQGAVGVGIDVVSGKTTLAVHQGRRIARHPDTGGELSGRVIPHWKQALNMATRLSAALGLGYLGVDRVLDGRRGPVVLEANARPGLAIQIANHRGLREMGDLVEDKNPKFEARNSKQIQNSKLIMTKT